MKEEKKPYRQDVAFVGMKKELAGLKVFIDKQPSEILFIHGPKSSYLLIFFSSIFSPSHFLTFCF